MSKWNDLCIFKEFKCDRGLPDALAELTANARDASREEYPEFVFDKRNNSAVLVDHGQRKLEPRHFLSGYSDSRHNATKAGVHGQGLKDALAIVIHLGYEVAIRSHNATYEFALQPSSVDPTVDTIHMRQNLITNDDKMTCVFLRAPPGDTQLMHAVAKIAPPPTPPPPTTTEGCIAALVAEYAQCNILDLRATRTAARSKKAPAPQKLAPAADGAAGKITFMGLERYYNGPPLYYDWDLTVNANKERRKKWFDDNQHIKQEYVGSFEGIVRTVLQQTKCTFAGLPMAARGSLEYCLLATQADVHSYYTDQTPPQLKFTSIHSALEVLNRDTDKQHRKVEALVKEIRTILQVRLQVSILRPPRPAFVNEAPWKETSLRPRVNPLSWITFALLLGGPWDARVIPQRHARQGHSTTSPPGLGVDRRLR